MEGGRSGVGKGLMGKASGSMIGGAANTAAAVPCTIIRVPSSAAADGAKVPTVRLKMVRSSGESVRAEASSVDRPLPDMSSVTRPFAPRHRIYGRNLPREYFWTIGNKVVRVDEEDSIALYGTDAANPRKVTDVEKRRYLAKKRKRLKFEKEEEEDRVRKRALRAAEDTVFRPEKCGMKEKKEEQSCCWQQLVNDKLLGKSNWTRLRPTSVSDWSVQDVCGFIGSLHFSSWDITEAFRQEKIDGEALLLMTQDDLIDHMELKLGAALKIYNTILSLKHRQQPKSP